MPASARNAGLRSVSRCVSGQAITANSDGGVPLFDREKCIHCAACLWNCAYAREEGRDLTNVDFRAGSGGLHS
ncbi:MAG: 4Fe-4S ferredoxin, partial [Candidatus Omnitrophota bacterium]